MADADATALRFAGFTLDPAARTLVDAEGRDIPLRRSEYELLRAFLAAPGRALSRDHLLEAVAGRRSEPFDRSVDMLVARLRQKIEPDPKEPRLIVTVPGVGYRFAARPRPASAEGDATPVAEPTPPPAPPASPERRQLTVLRCGLCGPALLAARRDPENLQRLLVAFHAQCAAIVQRAGGTVARRLGETVLAYFGYPEAHEDEAERAIWTALRLVAAAGAIETGPYPGAPRARVGIATGLVRGGDPLGAGSPTRSPASSCSWATASAWPLSLSSSRSDTSARCRRMALSRGARSSDPSPRPSRSWLRLRPRMPATSVRK